MKSKLRIKMAGLIVLSMFMFSMVHAQAKVGIRGGVIISNENFQGGNLNQDVKSKLGADVALVADFHIGEVFSIGPEIHWMQKGAKIKDLNGTVGQISKTFNYLEIPVLVKLHFGEGVGFFLLGGPSAGYLLDGRDKDMDGKTNDIDLNFYKRAEFGLHFGGGITLGPLNVDLRYILGLSNIFDNDTGVEIKNRSLGAGVSLMF